MSFLIIVIPIGAIAYLVFRVFLNWQANRPNSGDGIPVSPEELNREKPESIIADISYDYLDPLLERIEHATDWGFNSNQRAALILRANSLFPGHTTYAIFPVQYDAAPTDLLIHFGRINHEMITCRFQGSSAIVKRIKSFLEDIPHNAA
jgi:hypothetical protein